MPGSHAADCIWHWERYFNWLRSQARQSGYLLANRDILSKNKTSDTLFILGSGPSINAINSQGWNEISRHNSIGFNYFLSHPFVPTFFHMELLRKDMEMFSGCYSLRREAYKYVPFMINYHFLTYDNLKPADLDFIDHKLITVPRMYVEARPEDLARVVDFSQNHIESLDDDFLLHYRGSLCLMISFGILLGYKKIVLVGVDLNSPDYFYCDERYANAGTQALRQRRCQSMTVSNSLHATADPSFIPSTITIDRVLHILDDTVLRRRGIDLFVYNKDSLLYPSFPAWHDR